MSFTAAKIAWALLSPLNLIMVLLLLGTLCVILSREKTGLVFIFTGIFLFATLGLLPIGYDLLAGLENTTVRPAKPLEKVDGIIVLGGAFETELSLHYGQPVVNDNIGRVLDGLTLARQYPAARLVFSGGEGLLLHQDHPESKDAAAFIKAYGFTPAHVIYEEKSRNTLENLKMTHDLVMPKKGETWLLVTSAYHIPRALEAARQAGWNSLVPWPTSYHTDGTMAGPQQIFKVLDNFYDTQLAFHEYAGLLTYRWQARK